MGFLKTLGKIGSVAAPFALAPFTGGMSLIPSLALKGGVSAGLGALSGGKKGAALGAAAGIGGDLLGRSGALTKLRQLPNVAAPGQAGAGQGGGVLDKIFGKGGMDPTMLAMLGISALGGGEDENQLHSFRAPGENSDPVQALQQALEGIYRTGQGLTNRPPVQLRSSYVQSGPAPVQLKGIPFQIGGGLGRDPALDDPSLLMSTRNAAIQQMDPFQSIAQTTPGKPSANAGPKLRGPMVDKKKRELT